MKTPHDLGIEYEILDLEGDLEGEPQGPARPRRLIPEEIACLSGGLFDGVPRVEIPLESFFPPGADLAAPRVPRFDLPPLPGAPARADSLLPLAIPLRSDSLLPVEADAAPASAPSPGGRAAALRWTGLVTAAAFGMIVASVVGRPAHPARAPATANPTPAIHAVDVTRAVDAIRPVGMIQPVDTNRPVGDAVTTGEERAVSDARSAGVKQSVGATPGATAPVRGGTMTGSIQAPLAPSAPSAVPAVAPEPTMEIAPPAPPPADPLHRPEAVQGVPPQRAAVAIAAAARGAASCLGADDLRRTMAVTVSFAPSGRATRATVDGGPHRGTAAGSCIAQRLRAAVVAPFEGPAITVHTSIHVR